MGLIHKFIQDGDFYVIDVNSGSVHVVDNLVYDLLDEESLRKDEELIKDFKDKYSEEEIKEALEDIKELRREGLLYSMDLYEDIARNHEGDSYIKACLLYTSDAADE